MPELCGLWRPYEEGYGTTASTRQAIHAVANSLEVAVVETSVDSLTELLVELEHLNALGKPSFDAIYISPNPLVQSDESMVAIMTFAETHGLPVVGNTTEQVQNGALLTYTADTIATGRLAASLADRIFQGINPGVIPIAYTDPVLFLNHQTAQMLGLTIDEGILAQATEIIW